MKNADADMIQRLGRSNLYTEFKQAFGASVGPDAATCGVLAAGAP